MFQKFYPDEWVDSTYVIPFEQYYEKGYRGILFDIDNTLVRHGEPATKEAEELFERLHKIGFSTCLISNNKKERVDLFTENIDTHSIYKAGKPKIAGYEKAMEEIGCNRKNTLFVGDQLFTDVCGAKRTGIYSILVKPIHPKEEIQIVLKRYLEKIVLAEYKRHMKKSGVKEK